MQASIARILTKHPNESYATPEKDHLGNVPSQDDDGGGQSSAASTAWEGAAASVDIKSALLSNSLSPTANAANMRTAKLDSSSSLCLFTCVF